MRRKKNGHENEIPSFRVKIMADRECFLCYRKVIRMQGDLLTTARGRDRLRKVW